MNRTEFEQEMHEYIHESYKDFIEYQNVVNNILDEFHRVCQLGNIEYYVAFGSLLGLVRDNGNIPWDYDIDVVVSIDLRDKLIETLENNLGKDYYYVYDNNLHHYPATCLRVCKKGYTYMAFHVDVFFLLGCPSEKKKQKRFFDKIFWTYYARQAHNIIYHIETPGESKFKRYARILKAWVKYPIPNSMLRKIETSLYYKYPITESRECTIYYPLRKTYTSSSFKKSKDITINGKTYRIPENEELFLTERYGSFKEYLPIKDRFDEFYKMYVVVKERQDFYKKHLMKDVEMKK